MRRFDLAGKSSQTICECAPWARGGSWSKDGTILFAPHTNSAIQRIPAAGGTPVPVTEIDPKVADASHRFPVWLPDGKHFLFTYFSNNAEVTKTIGGIYAASIEKGEPIRRIVPDASSVVYLDAGYILFVRAGTLIAMAFDAKKLEVSGEAIPVDDAVLFGANTGAASASASAFGDIAYGIGTAEPPAEIVWMDRQGHVTQSTGQTAVFDTMSVAPDGTRFAVVRYEGGNAGQIWIGDFARGALVPLTRGANDSYDPVWSPDGEKVAFVNRDSGDDDIFIQSVRETTPRQLVESGAEHDSDITDWSTDGRYLIYRARPKSGAAHDSICALDLVEKKSRTLLQDQFNMNEGRLSPDGRWLAYTSEESGTPQVYVRPFPALDRKWLVSTASGSGARWRKDGRELTYVARVPEGERFMVVELSPNASGPNPSLPKELFPIDPSMAGLVPVGDHTRILALRQVDSTVRNGVRVILDWSSGLTKRPQ
jgi:Tol biopolymer transport system component